MNQSIITTLVYETKVSIGSYFHLVTKKSRPSLSTKTMSIPRFCLSTLMVLLCTSSKTKMALFTEPISL